MIIFMVSVKIQPESFYIILRRSGTKKTREISLPTCNLREISPVFLGKGKKSIDLETVVEIHLIDAVVSKNYPTASVSSTHFVHVSPI
jgi:hypothetical protein